MATKFGTKFVNAPLFGMLAFQNVLQFWCKNIKCQYFSNILSKFGEQIMRLQIVIFGTTRQKLAYSSEYHEIAKPILTKFDHC